MDCYETLQAIGHSKYSFHGNKYKCSKHKGLNLPIRKVFEDQYFHRLTMVDYVVSNLFRLFKNLTSCLKTCLRNQLKPLGQGANIEC
jgi:hypothetical protein